ncbi:hypothetical protein OA56_09040 [Tepidiphilus sp. HLB4]
MFFCGKEVGLDRGAARHGSGSSRIRTEDFYQRPGVEGFFEMPCISRQGETLQYFSQMDTVNRIYSFEE